MQSSDLSMIQQSALMGHVLADSRVYDSITGLGLSLGDGLAFGDVNLMALWKRIIEHYGRHRRIPTPDEIRATFNTGEPKEAASWERELQAAIGRRDSIGYDTIQPTLLRMAQIKTAAAGMSEAHKMFSKAVEAQARHGGAAGLDQHVKAMALIQELSLKLANLEAAGAGQRFRSMSERVVGLADAYKGRRDLVIPTGINYLDDVTGGGVGVNDLWIFSATTGSGKTQAMIEIAKNAAKPKEVDGKKIAGKRVAFFALEADDREMEARILFPTLLRLFNEASVTNRTVYVDPVKWLRGDADTHALLDPFVERAEAEAAADLATLKTMYLGFGKYKAADLERDILARSKDSDLIVIDHLGYVALDDGNENKETTDLLFLLRDLVKLDRGVPIITACHTRKTDNRTPKKFAPLIPDRNDIKGSGAITQCATAVVMLSKVREPVLTVNDAVVQSPTIIQLQKDRRDGRDDYAAVCSFNIKTRKYAPTYAIGRFEKGDTLWTPKNPPPWATHATTAFKPFGAIDKQK